LAEGALRLGSSPGMASHPSFFGTCFLDNTVKSYTVTLRNWSSRSCSKLGRISMNKEIASCLFIRYFKIEIAIKIAQADEDSIAKDRTRKTNCLQ
jgi:hypothetical protein